MARVKKEPKKTTAFGSSAEEKETYKKEAEKRHMSVSEFLRTAAREKIDEKRNEPAVMLNLVELTREIEEMKGIIPKEKIETMKTYIGNIMILKGGKDHADF